MVLRISGASAGLQRGSGARGSGQYRVGNKDTDCMMNGIATMSSQLSASVQFCAPALSLCIQVRDDSLDLLVSLQLFLDSVSHPSCLFVFSSVAHQFIMCVCERANLSYDKQPGQPGLLFSCTTMYNMCHRWRIIGSGGDTSANCHFF